MALVQIDNAARSATHRVNEVKPDFVVGILGLDALLGYSVQ